MTREELLDHTLRIFGRAAYESAALCTPSALDILCGAYTRMQGAGELDVNSPDSWNACTTRWIMEQHEKRTQEEQAVKWNTAVTQFNAAAENTKSGYEVLREAHWCFFKDDTAESRELYGDVAGHDRCVVARINDIVDDLESCFTGLGIKRAGVVYILDLPGGVKIGRTSNLQERMRTHKSAARNLGVPLKRIAFTGFNFESIVAERWMHRELDAFRVDGSEFFTVSFKDAVDLLAEAPFRDDMLFSDLHFTVPTWKSVNGDAVSDLLSSINNVVSGQA